MSDIAELPTREHLNTLKDNIKSEKARLFCEYKAAGLGNSKAAIEAGYAPKGANPSAYGLMKKSNIKAYIEALKQTRTLGELVILKREQRMNELSQAALICFGKAPSIDLSTGKPSNVFKFDPRTGKELIAELNKMSGEYAPDKLQIDARVQFNLNF